MSFCDVTVTSILQEKIGNIVFLKLHIFLYLKIDINHFYPKIPTGAQISTQLPTLEHSAILLIFIKLSFVKKIFVLSIFEWPFYTDFTVVFVSKQLLLVQFKRLP